MSAVPVFIPDISARRSSSTRSVLVRPVDRRSPIKVHATTAPATCQLTDRGIAVVMLITAVIMAVAITVIALTAVRVTSSDYDLGLHQASQTRD